MHQPTAPARKLVLREFARDFRSATTVADAVEHLLAGRNAGKVVVTLD